MSFERLQLWSWAFFVCLVLPFFSCAIGTPISSEITPKTTKTNPTPQGQTHKHYSRPKTHTNKRSKNKNGTLLWCVSSFVSFFGDVFFVSLSLHKHNTKEGKKEKQKLYKSIQKTQQIGHTSIHIYVALLANLRILRQGHIILYIMPALLFLF